MATRGVATPPASARCELPCREAQQQAILGPIWQALTLNIGRDNKGLLSARAGRIIKVNPPLLQLCGRSSGKLVGREVASKLFACLQAADRWETVFKTAAEEPIAIEVTRQSLAPGLGEFEVYAIRDLRARQRASVPELWQREEERRLHKEKLDAALDNMLQGLAMFMPSSA